MAGPHGAEREEARAALATFSLLRWEAGNEALRIHRLVQEVTREQLPEERREAWLGGAVAPRRGAGGYGRSRGHLGADDRLMNELGLFLNAKGGWAEAEPLDRRALEILQRFTAETSHPHQHLQQFTESYEGLLTRLGQHPTGLLARARALLRSLGILPGR